MIKEIDGEEIVLNYYTEIENKESSEVQEFVNLYQLQYDSKRLKYLVFMVMTFLLSLFSFIFLTINNLGTGITLGIIFFLFFAALMIIYEYNIAHLRAVLKELKEMLEIAKMNDEERHKEKIRFEEKIRLEELDQMKQIEIKTRSLPPRKPKENNKWQ
mgnify:CR=1 FL=1